MVELKMPFEEKNAVIIDAVENGNIMSYQVLNQKIHDYVEAGEKNIILNNVCGQRFIGAALKSDVNIFINGVAGNDLGIFMDGPQIFINGNAEDQAGNTMNAGKIIVNGNTGDVTGLSARGGEVYVKGTVGFRIGIHIKEYRGKMPKLIVGSSCKDYFGEYMAGGMLIVLGLDISDDGIKEINNDICGNCIGSGIHGGTIYLRTDNIPEHLLGIGAKAVPFTEDDKKIILPYVKNFCEYFGVPEEKVWNKNFIKITAASKRPYGSNYCSNLI